MNEIKVACRSCGKRDLRMILSLGRMPLANALLTSEELTLPEACYPLDLVFCPNCKLVQITKTVPPEKLFGEYLYFSSFSDTMLKHAKELVNSLIQSRRLDSSSSVIEVASNDGYLLQHYQQKGVPVLGIEPAANIARVAREERGTPTLCEFFGEGLARRLCEEGKRADVIHAHNVLAHVADLNGFVAGISQLLKEDGVVVIEVPYLRDLIEHCEFDTIYHEHLCYFSLSSLNYLVQRHGLMIENVERVPIHGGSLQLFITKSGLSCASDSVKRVLREEVDLGMDEFGFYENFARRVEILRDSLLVLLVELKQQEKRIAAYGAAAKGSTLLNYFQIGADLLDFAVDRSKYKQGRYMPGMHLPIYSPEKLLEAMPDYVLMLTWNFADEVLDQQEEYRRRGGRFIIPIPEVKVV